jgi:DNA-binding response OmpR family regulator
MIVDDDYDTRTVVKTILTGSGFRVEDCESGMVALEKLKSYTPDLILLDIMMPVMSGYDVVVHLKQKPETQNIPVIMLTAKGEPEDLITGYKDYAVDYYIPKPFTTRQLLAGINLILGEA